MGVCVSEDSTTLINLYCGMCILLIYDRMVQYIAIIHINKFGTLHSVGCPSLVNNFQSSSMGFYVETCAVIRNRSTGFKNGVLYLKSRKHFLLIHMFANKGGLVFHRV